MKPGMLLFGLCATLGLSATVMAQGVVARWTEAPGPLGLGYPVPVPVDTALPFDGFRSYSGLHARHQGLLMASPRVSGAVVGQTLLERDIWAYRLGSPDALTPEGLSKSAIMYAGTMHAREWQSPEVVTGLMELIADSEPDHHWLDYVSDHINIVVVPVINIDGFLQTQNNTNSNWLGTDNRYPETWPRDGRMRRKNHRGADELLFTVADHLEGVDLNRNNPPFWPGPPRTAIEVDLTYRGPAPQSEPEIQALLEAINLAPAERLRFYSDMHSYTKVFFSVFTSNTRRNAIQTRLLATLSSHHQALPGNQLYVDSQEPANIGIGTTSEYFGHSFAIPSMTWEIEPGQDGGAEYGGLRRNGHDGFILPESEIRRVRENLAQSMAVAAYHMAGPPHLAHAQVHDAQSGAVVWSARWDLQSDTQRSLNLRPSQPLTPNRNYTLWLGFSKPMRWRENGVVRPFPGQSAPSLDLTVKLEIDGTPLALSTAQPRWLNQPGAAPQGYQRYRDDAMAIDFSIDDTSANRDLIALLAASGGRATLSVDTFDMTGHRLDANPATVVDFQQGAWVGYEATLPTTLDVGGPDRTLSLAVATQAPSPVYAVNAGHSAMWFNESRSGEGWLLEILEDNRALGYWFTFDEQGEPRWLLGIGEIEANRIHFAELLAPVGGEFGDGFDPDSVVREVVGSASIVLTGCDSGWFEYQAFGQTQSIDLMRLTRTLGTDCEADSPAVSTLATRSGSWFDPTHSGEGYAVQLLDQNRALVMWYSYDAQGSQYWMIGEGQHGDGQIDVPEMLSVRGARFGRDFDPEDVERSLWGSLQMDLECQLGSAGYASVLPEFGAGQFQLERITYLDGLRCDD